jgi:hypothetical protein
MNWYKKAQYKGEYKQDYFDDLFKKDFTQKNLTNEEEKKESRTISLYRNFDATMDDVDRDKNGNFIFSPQKCEQGVLWFAHDLQNNPQQYYDRGGQYLLTYPLTVQYHYIEKTYDNGDVIKEPVTDYDARLENSREWAGYNLPEGFLFSYKTQKHIICEKNIIASYDLIKEVNNELV